MSFIRHDYYVLFVIIEQLTLSLFSKFLLRIIQNAAHTKCYGCFSRLSFAPYTWSALYVFFSFYVTTCLLLSLSKITIGLLEELTTIRCLIKLRIQSETNPGSSSVGVKLSCTPGCLSVINPPVNQRFRTEEKKAISNVCESVKVKSRRLYQGCPLNRFSSVLINNASLDWHIISHAHQEHNISHSTVTAKPNILQEFPPARRSALALYFTKSFRKKSYRKKSWNMFPKKSFTSGGGTCIIQKVVPRCVTIFNSMFFQSVKAIYYHI